MLLLIGGERDTGTLINALKMLYRMEIKTKLLGIAIAILFALFIGYGIEVFHPISYPDELYRFTTQESCVQAGGMWQDYAEPEPVNGPRGYCQTPPDKDYAYQQASQQHDKIVFIVSLIAGVIGIVVGVLLQKESIGPGFIGGGILLILYGSIRYWPHASDWLKFVLLGIALAVVVWVGYKLVDRAVKHK